MTNPAFLWQLTPDRANEWRAIRLEALADTPDAFGSVLADWADRPLADFAARLAAVETWAAGWRIGQPLAVAGWQPGWTPGTEHMAWITAVFVSPKARGQGLGKLIFTRIAERARVAGMTEMGLRVGTANGPAQALYQRCGFRPVGKAFLNERGIPEIEMHGPLAP